MRVRAGRAPTTQARSARRRARRWRRSPTLRVPRSRAAACLRRIRALHALRAVWEPIPRDFESLPIAAALLFPLGRAAFLLPPLLALALSGQGTVAISRMCGASPTPTPAPSTPAPRSGPTPPTQPPPATAIAPTPRRPSPPGGPGTATLPPDVTPTSAADVSHSALAATRRRLAAGGAVVPAGVRLYQPAVQHLIDQAVQLWSPGYRSPLRRSMTWTCASSTPAT